MNYELFQIELSGYNAIGQVPLIPPDFHVKRKWLYAKNRI